MKQARRRDLLRILRAGHAPSQDAIVDALRARGHDVTQATVSRDLRAIGAVKLRVDGELVYRLPDLVPHSQGGDLMARNLRRTLADFALEVRLADSMVVVLTAPGHAAAVARAIDLAAPDEVVGTVAGDDTIFVATSGREMAEGLARIWGVVQEEIQGGKL